jgi:hypothetical protein
MLIDDISKHVESTGRSDRQAPIGLEFMGPAIALQAIAASTPIFLAAIIAHRFDTVRRPWWNADGRRATANDGRHEVRA